jgi:hypothetical protein
MRIRQGGLIKPKLNLLFYGSPGSGKTTQALEIAKFKREDGTPFRVWVFDAESGGTDEGLEELEEQGIDTRNVFVAYTQSLQEVESYVDKIAKKDILYYLDDDGCDTDEIIVDAYGQPFVPDAVVVDGTSVLKLTTTQSLLQLSQKRNKIKARNSGASAEEIYVATQNANLEIRDYSQLAYASQRLVLSLMALPVHVILTAREKDETISAKENGQFVSTPTGRKIFDSFKGIDYNCKSIIRMFRNDEDQVCYSVEKDRTKTFEVGQVVVNPSLLAFEETLNKGAGRKEYSIRNDLDDAIQKDRKIFEKEVLGDLASDDAPSTTTGEKSAEELYNEVCNIMRGLSKVEQDKKKSALASANLPSTPAAMKKSDAATLQEILTVLKA